MHRLDFFSKRRGRPPARRRSRGSFVGCTAAAEYLPYLRKVPTHAGMLAGRQTRPVMKGPVAAGVLGAAYPMPVGIILAPRCAAGGPESQRVGQLRKQTKVQYGGRPVTARASACACVSPPCQRRTHTLSLTHTHRRRPPASESTTARRQTRGRGRQAKPASSPA